MVQIKVTIFLFFEHGYFTKKKGWHRLENMILFLLENKISCTMRVRLSTSTISEGLNGFDSTGIIIYSCGAGCGRLHDVYPRD